MYLCCIFLPNYFLVQACCNNEENTNQQVLVLQSEKDHPPHTQNAEKDYVYKEKLSEGEEEMVVREKGKTEW